MGVRGGKSIPNVPVDGQPQEWRPVRLQETSHAETKSTIERLGVEIGRVIAPRICGDNTNDFSVAGGRKHTAPEDAAMETRQEAPDDSMEG